MVTDAGVQVQLSLDKLAVLIGDAGLQDVVVLDTYILGGDVERHIAVEELNEI